MEYQKFIPEGWKITDEKICINDLKEAMETNKVLQGLVSKCDKNYSNVHFIPCFIPLEYLSAWKAHPSGDGHKIMADIIIEKIKDYF